MAPTWTRGNDGKIKPYIPEADLCNDAGTGCGPYGAVSQIEHYSSYMVAAYRVTGPEERPRADRILGAVHSAYQEPVHANCSGQSPLLECVIWQRKNRHSKNLRKRVREININRHNGMMETKQCTAEKMNHLEGGVAQQQAGPAGPQVPVGPGWSYWCARPKGEKVHKGEPGAAGAKGEKQIPGQTGAAGPKGDKGRPRGRNDRCDQRKDGRNF